MALSAEDFNEIQMLYSRYGIATDSGPAEAWVDCFSPEGSFELRGAVHSGPEALSKYAQAIRGRYAGGMHVGDRHWIGNVLIEESAGGVTGRAYFAIFKTALMPRVVKQTGIYNDTLVKTPRGWKYASRKVTFEE